MLLETRVRSVSTVEKDTVARIAVALEYAFMEETSSIVMNVAAKHFVNMENKGASALFVAVLVFASMERFDTSAKTAAASFIAFT